MSDIDWEDQHGDACHVVLGHGDVEHYAPSLSSDLDDDVVGLIEVTPKGDPITSPVYLTRAAAETLHRALGRVLAPSPVLDPFAPDTELRGQIRDSYVARIRTGVVPPWALADTEVEGARRSEAIAREELDTLAPDDPSRPDIEAYAQAWADRAAKLEGN